MDMKKVKFINPDSPQERFNRFTSILIILTMTFLIFYMVTVSWFGEIDIEQGVVTVGRIAVSVNTDLNFTGTPLEPNKTYNKTTTITGKATNSTAGETKSAVAIANAAAEPNNNRVYKYFEAHEGYYYTYSAYLKTTATADVLLRTELNNGNEYKWNATYTSQHTGNNEWQYFETTTTTLVADANLYYFIYLSKTANTYIDNVKVVRSDGTVIVYENFETGTSGNATNWLRSANTMNYTTADYYNATYQAGRSVRASTMGSSYTSQNVHSAISNIAKVDVQGKYYLTTAWVKSNNTGTIQLANYWHNGTDYNWNGSTGSQSYTQVGQWQMLTTSTVPANLVTGTNVSYTWSILANANIVYYVDNINIYEIDETGNRTVIKTYNFDDQVVGGNGGISNNPNTANNGYIEHAVVDTEFFGKNNVGLNTNDAYIRVKLSSNLKINGQDIITPVYDASKWIYDAPTGWYYYIGFINNTTTATFNTGLTVSDAISNEHAGQSVQLTLTVWAIQRDYQAHLYDNDWKNSPAAWKTAIATYDTVLDAN